MPRAQARTFELVGFVGGTVTVKQNVEGLADFLHPLLDGGKGSKRDDEDAGIELFEFFLAGAQLCGMFAAGYSAKVTKEDEQNVIPVFQDFTKRNLLAISRGKSEIGGGSIGFECQVSGSRCQASGEVAFCPDETLQRRDEDQRGKDGKQNGGVCRE